MTSPAQNASHLDWNEAALKMQNLGWHEPLKQK